MELAAHQVVGGGDTVQAINFPRPRKAAGTGFTHRDGGQTFFSLEGSYRSSAQHEPCASRRFAGMRHGPRGSAVSHIRLIWVGDIGRFLYL